MADLQYLAKRGSVDEFLDAYGRVGGDPTPLLVPAMSQKDSGRRIAIASRLLDDGADASFVAGEDRINVLHVLFSRRRGQVDFAREAALLQRMLDGGADINLMSPRFGHPIQVLRNMDARDQELVPFYEVIFARDDIDLDVIVRQDACVSLRDLLSGLPEGRSILASFARNYSSASR